MQNIKILVVDDEKRMVDLVKLYLEREGFTVEEAFNGQQALDMIAKTSYDLIILDLMLPVVDGWTVCKELRKKYDTPVIMLTARGEEFDKVLGFELGADDYVVKPFSPRTTARVKALLRRMASRKMLKPMPSVSRLVNRSDGQSRKVSEKKLHLPQRSLTFYILWLKIRIRYLIGKNCWKKYGVMIFLAA